MNMKGKTDARTSVVTGCLVTIITIAINVVWAGLFMMVSLGLIHDEVFEGVRPAGFSTCVILAILLRATFEPFIDGK